MLNQERIWKYSSSLPEVICTQNVTLIKILLPLSTLCSHQSHSGVSLAWNMRHTHTLGCIKEETHTTYSHGNWTHSHSHTVTHTHKHTRTHTHTPNLRTLEATRLSSIAGRFTTHREIRLMPPRSHSGTPQSNMHTRAHTQACISHCKQLRGSQAWLGLRAKLNEYQTGRYRWQP